MTQDKKFKKSVRARMKETGETYMQARRALGGDDRAPQRLRRVGYWRSEGHPEWPDPLDMVDASWSAEERAKVLTHLRRGHVLLRSLMDSWCRLGCGPALGGTRAFFEGDGVRDEDASPEERQAARKRAARLSEEANMTAGSHGALGRSDMTDGVYVWPEGLAHYVEHHNVRLPHQFVQHVLENPLPEPPEETYIHPYMALADRKLWDDFWWRVKGTLAAPVKTLDDLRRELQEMWHEVYSTGNAFGYHIYADGPEDGRAHTSLCGAATTRTWETKTPGGPHCETCQLLKVQEILKGQKVPGSSLKILHDADLWKAHGGGEKERVALRDELWGEPPGHKAWGAKLLEIETPFNPGWYFHDSEYPDEGSVGPYKLREDAVQAARLAEYDVDDPDAVTFWEQKKPAAVLQRFAVEHLRNEILTTVQEFKVEGRVRDVAGRFQELLTERLRAAVKKLEAQGVRTPPEDEFGMEVTSQTDADQGVLSGRVWLRHPERYPQLVSDLTDAGIIEPRYLVSVEFKEPPGA